ncbi:MAG: tail fiber protein [Selenomonas sp.]|nr:tail fiber protein [Selenomonas sp.]
MGGIIVWPKDSDPSTSSNIWLECNGQTFDTNRFKKLYKALGTNKVPDFRGMFLRGAGSQSFTQNNGDHIGETSRNYESGDIGSIQGDAMMPYKTYSAVLAAVHNSDPYGSEMLNYYKAYDVYPIENYAWGRIGGYLFNANVEQTKTDGSNQIHSSGPLFYKEYRLEGSGESYSLREETKPFEIRSEMTGYHFFQSTQTFLPTANEIRPINMAVKYYIRAK